MAESVLIDGSAVVVVDPYIAKAVVIILDRHRRVVLDARADGVSVGAAWSPALEVLRTQLIAMVRNHARPEDAAAPSQVTAGLLDALQGIRDGEGCEGGAWLSVETASERLGVSTARVRAIAGALGGVKHRGVWRIPAGEVEAYAGRRKPAPARRSAA